MSSNYDMYRLKVGTFCHTNIIRVAIYVLVLGLLNPEETVNKCTNIKKSIAVLQEQL